MTLLTPDVRIITDADLPREFQASSMYPTLAAGVVDAFKHFCATHGIFYYARPRESFNVHEAARLAREAGCTQVLLEDLS